MSSRQLDVSTVRVVSSYLGSARWPWCRGPWIGPRPLAWRWNRGLPRSTPGARPRWPAWPTAAQNRPWPSSVSRHLLGVIPTVSNSPQKICRLKGGHWTSLKVRVKLRAYAFEKKIDLCRLKLRRYTIFEFYAIV